MSGQGKHTPGPWAAFSDKSGNGHTNVVAVVPRTRVIASLPGKHKSDPDICLIAAAPDMLEALENLTPILEAAESNASGNPEWPWVSKRINAARAAIGKARGAA